MMVSKPGFRRAALLLVASAGLVWALVVVLARHRGGDPGTTLRPWWAQRRVEKPNVVLVTLDTTRADHVGCYGDPEARTPAIDALARRGVQFTQAATVAPLTLPAHSSIMTGFYPTYHGVRLNGSTALSQEQTTLAEALSREGYQTGAFVGAFVLDGRWGLNQGFGVYDDQFDMKKFKHLDLAGVQRPGNQVMDAALHWLEGHKDKPFFAWVHLYDPHSPYEPPEPLLSEFRTRGPVALYDGEIAFADQQVARLVAWLEKAALDRKTILVVLGDHGEGLGSHGEGTHGYFLYDYALHVPFVVAAPFDALRGVRVDAQVSLVDVFPTVLALAGIESTARVHGRSLLPLMLHRTPLQAGFAYSESMTPNLQYGWSALHSLRSPRYKLIQAPRPELYDLLADPREEANVFDQHRDVAGEMAARLERLVEETSRGAPAPEAANLDKETVERLAALGYVGAAATPRKAADSSRPLADPKDKLEVFTAVQRAGEMIARDEYAPAAEALESALREEPSMPQALLMLGACYSDLGRKKEAKAQFDRVLQGDPQSVQGLIGLANVLLEEGQTEEVVTLCKRTLSLDERNTQAYALLGDVYVRQHRPQKALPYLEKAVEIQPKLTQNRLNLAACLVEVKQLPRAEATLEAIVRDHPRFPGAQFNLGVLHEEQGRPEEARAAYAAELSTYPDHFKARFNLGKLLSQLGDWPGSITQLREAVRLAPKRPEGYLFLARSLLEENASLDEVQGLAEEGLALAQTPDLRALGWFLLADVFNRKHQPGRMNEALAKARMQVSSEKGESRHAAQRD
jgi:arylsulfatase A-like enzyme/cytochrome c-type biogenesis protein CcmH/NrfG